MKKLTFVIVAFLLVSISAKAQIAPVDDNGLAIGGYDVVSYFSGTAKEGVKKYAVKHNGATYYFSSKANQKKFKTAPSKYLPQFDGFCAWGVSEKKVKFPINPEAFDVVDGKLYLFFNGPFDGKNFNTLEYWNLETSRMVKDAHNYWPEVKNK